MDFRTGQGPLGVVSGDFNRDSIPDLFVADYAINHLGTTASILLGNGDGTFRERTTVGAALGIVYLSIGDLNHDGVPDVIANNQGVGSFAVDTTAWAVPPISVFIANGDGTFQPRVDYGRLPEFRDSQVTTVADMNGDGDLDVVMGIADVWVRADMTCTATLGSTTVTNTLNGFTSSLVGTWVTKTGNPDPSQIGIPPGTVVVSVESPSSLTISQPATGSGTNVFRYMDIGPNYVNIWHGNGDGTLSTPTSTIDAGIGASAVAVGDVNEDGYPDIATTNFASSRFVWMQPAIQLMISNGDGTFAPPISFSTPRLPNDLKIADTNGDGNLDFITANWIYNSLSVLLGNGDGTFASSMELTTAGTANQVEVSDLNRDGLMDLATVANAASGLVSVFLGTGGGAFGPRLDFPVGSAPRAFVLRDLNRDGRVDLAATNFQTTTVSVYLNTSCVPEDAITGVFPAHGGDAGDITVSIYGCGIADNTTAKLVRLGESDIDGAIVSNLADGFLIVRFDLRSRLRGQWDVVLSTPGQATAVRPNGFTIEAPIAPLFWAERGGPNSHRVGTLVDNPVYGGNSGNNDFGSVDFASAPSSGTAGRFRRTASLRSTAALDCGKPYQWAFAYFYDDACAQSFSVSRICQTLVVKCGTTKDAASVTTKPNGTVGITVGMSVTGPGVAKGTTVKAVVDDRTLTLSSDAILSDNDNLTFSSQPEPVGVFNAPEIGCFTMPVGSATVAGVRTYYRVTGLASGGEGKRCTAVFNANSAGTVKPGSAIASENGLLALFWKNRIQKIYTISCVTGSTTTVSSAGLFGNIEVGMTVTGTGIAPGTTVTMVNNASTLTVSNPTTPGTNNLTFTFGGSPSLPIDAAFQTTLEDKVQETLCNLLQSFENGVCGDINLARTDELILRAIDDALKAIDPAPIDPLGTVKKYRDVFDQIYSSTGTSPAYRELFRKLLGKVAEDYDRTGAWMDKPQCVYAQCAGAWDPNAKEGPPGAGLDRYLLGNRPFTYTVFFENLPTATAPAAEVSVTDRLDAAALDLSTFALGPITFGENTVIPLPGLNPFQTEVDLRPDQNLKVRVIAQLNPTTGELVFRFQTLDAVTGLYPSDPLAGFLPPDVNPPEGAGSITYIVTPRSNLATGTQIRNRARIIFDTNPPIDTDEWVNTIDRTGPMSHVDALIPVTGDEARIAAHWVGTDLGSGIGSYAIYVSDNGSSYDLWTTTEAAQDTFPGVEGHTYAFYSVAKDLVGNEETAPTEPDATITVRSAVAMGFEFTPGTLNLRAMGHWVTGYLEPVAPFTPADIDTPSVRINGTVPVDLAAPIEIGDHDNDGIPELIVKFNRAAVDLTLEAGDNVPVNVTGTVAGRFFSGTDHVRVIRAVVSAPAAGASLTPGAATTVAWTMPSGIHVESVALLSSRDGGSSWNLEANGLANTGSYQWHVPNEVAAHGRVAVVLVESSDETGFIVDGVVGVSGEFSIGNATGVGEEDAVPVFALRRAMPNPAFDVLRMNFSLPDGRPARMEVFSIAGRLVDAQEVGGMGPGSHTVTLGTRSKLASGVYIIRLTQGAKRLTARVVLVR